MKNLLLLLITLTTLSCSAQYNLKAQGKVVSNEPYEVWIKDYKKGEAEWIRWELWEHYEDYYLSAKENERIHVLWISQCTNDTIGEAYFSGGYHKEQVNDTIYLDGSTYEFGTWIYGED